MQFGIWFGCMPAFVESEMLDGDQRDGFYPLSGHHGPKKNQNVQFDHLHWVPNWTVARCRTPTLTQVPCMLNRVMDQVVSLARSSGYQARFRFDDVGASVDDLCSSKPPITSSVSGRDAFSASSLDKTVWSTTQASEKST